MTTVSAPTTPATAADDGDKPIIRLSRIDFGWFASAADIQALLRDIIAVECPPVGSLEDEILKKAPVDLTDQDIRTLARFIKAQLPASQAIEQRPATPEAVSPHETQNSVMAGPNSRRSSGSTSASSQLIRFAPSPGTLRQSKLTIADEPDVVARARNILSRISSSFEAVPPDRFVQKLIGNFCPQNSDTSAASNALRDQIAWITWEAMMVAACVGHIDSTSVDQLRAAVEQSPIAITPAIQSGATAGNRGLLSAFVGIGSPDPASAQTALMLWLLTRVMPAGWVGQDDDDGRPVRGGGTTRDIAVRPDGDMAVNWAFLSLFLLLCLVAKFNHATHSRLPLPDPPQFHPQLV